MNDIKCPVECKVVKHAINVHEDWGKTAKEILDFNKKYLLRCLSCSFNEDSDVPEGLKSDNSMDW